MCVASRGVLAGLAVLLALAAAAALAVLTGVAAAAFVALGAGLALAALVSPSFRQSPGWWGIPGMRRASGSTLAFTGMIVLYTVPAPVAAFAIAHTLTAERAPSASVGPSPSRSATPTPAETAAPSFFSPPISTPGAESPSPSPTPAATATGRPAPSPTPVNLCGAPANPWNYNFCGGVVITDPPATFCRYFNCITNPMTGKGYMVECKDGGYNLSGGKPNACSAHGGVRNVLFM